MYKLLSPVEFSITVSAATWCPVKKLDTPFYSLDLPMILHMFDDISLKHVYGGGGGVSYKNYQINDDIPAKYGVAPLGRYPEENHIQGTRPTNTCVCYLHVVTPHTRYLSDQCLLECARYSSNQRLSMLLAPGHPTYKVLIRPMLA